MFLVNSKDQCDFHRSIALMNDPLHHYFLLSFIASLLSSNCLKKAKYINLLRLTVVEGVHTEHKRC